MRNEEFFLIFWEAGVMDVLETISLSPEFYRSPMRYWGTVCDPRKRGYRVAITSGEPSIE